MILYFSATGNTKYVAEELARMLGDEALNLCGKIREKEYAPIRSEKPFVICSPVYVCEPPRFLTAFLRRVTLTGSRDVYFVFTSGGYAGISAVLARGIAHKKRMRYRGSAEFTMPRNYIASNAYGELETAQIEKRIRDTAQKLPGAAEAIRNGGRLRSRHVWLWEILVTLPFNPVWCRWMQGVRAFHVNGRCVSCGRCERGCPLKVIRMEGGKPIWSGKSCAHCMSCIQNCPADAIEYGQITREKKRYRFEKYRYALSAEQGAETVSAGENAAT